MPILINSIFPVNFVTSSLEREITEEEFEVANKHSSDVHNNEGNIISNEKYIFDKHPELKDIKLKIAECLQVYVDNIVSPKYRLEFYITQSWINYTSKGQYHHKHKHPNSIISGVFYFSANKEQDKIIFYKNVSYEQILIEKNANRHNCDSWELPVKSGDIVLFPSSLMHNVECTVGDHTRISLAFNIFVKGYLGDEKSSTALHL